MATKSTTRKRATAKKAATSKKAKPSGKAGSARKAPAAKNAPAVKKAVKKSVPKAAAKKVAKKKAATGKKTATKKAPSKSGAAKPKTTTRLKRVRRGSVEKRHQPLAALLLQKQAELMQAYAIAKTDTRDRLDDGTEDYIDYAVNSYAKDFMLSLTELERQQLQLVREAIHRLNRAEYGECLQCGVEIPMKRLEVAPWVRYCIRCQELEDQGLLPEIPFAGLDDEEAELDDDIEADDVLDDDDDDEEVAEVPDDDVLVVDDDDSEE